MQNKENNFKKLEQFYIAQRQDKGQETKANVMSQKAVFGFISNVVDLFLPKVISVISNALDARSGQMHKK